LSLSLLLLLFLSSLLLLLLVLLHLGRAGSQGVAWASDQQGALRTQAVRRSGVSSAEPGIAQQRSAAAAAQPAVARHPHNHRNRAALQVIRQSGFISYITSQKGPR
jgi:hypothetical protein